MGPSLISINFLIFLIVVLIVHFSLSHRFQWVFLLVASYFFYGITNRWEYVLLLAGVTALNYLIGLLIQSSSSRSRERLLLRLGLGFNIGILLYFKYYYFLGAALFPKNTQPLALGPGLVVPLGISYFIFKAIAYVIDVYRNKALCEHNIGKFSLFMSFFPEIAAGPIDRADNLLAQIGRPKTFSGADGVSGLRLILWGCFKKIVVANNLAGYVNQVYGSPREYSGIILVIITYFLAFQIYADFSGYTDIVRGIGRLLGYRMPINFDRPYLARSISEFWTRWHMTLSAWLRDYLFLPLSFFFSRRIKAPTFLAMDSNIVIYCSSALITFLLAGAWHGSAWTFVIWGVLHGLLLSASKLTKRIRKRIRQRFPVHRAFPGLVSAGKTLLCFHLVTLSWVFFRASSLQDAVYIIRSFLPLDLAGFARLFVNPLGQVDLGASKYGFVISGLAILFLIAAEKFQKGAEVPRFLAADRRSFRWAAYYALIIAVFAFGEFGLKEFIYAQF